MSEKKYYTIGATTPEAWERIHAVLTQDGTLDDNIPPRSVECVDLKEHSPTRAVYLLDDNEAAQLSQHPDVKFIELDRSKYPELFPSPPNEDFHYGNRYTAPTKNHRDIIAGGYPNPVTTADINRSGFQVLRGSTRKNPWATATSVVSSRIPNVTGTGKDVDVIVGDEGCWFGHVEFANNTGTGPADYIGGNPLPGNGTCDLLDLVLDGPYYIDPAWFNANPGTRLMTRWDGTIVPTETAARAWWSNAAQRSAQFASAGTVAIPSYYTRADCNGSNTSKPTYPDGVHGTPCAGQTYGRTHGWAYNANKWFVNAYGNYGLWPVDNYFDVMKIFHQTKPINPTYGNKNPTISSNSWGYRATQGSTGYYYFRQGTSGTGGVAYSSKPAFMQYLGSTGDGGRFKGEMIDNGLTTAGDEMIAAGVIFVAAAGNSNQQQVTSDHPNYNNYWSSSPSTPLTSATHNEFGESCYNTTNRRGFPQHIGKYYSGTATIYPAINIGALDDDYAPGSKERKVNYSDMGNDIDVFTPGDGTISANYGSGLLIPRYDQRTEPGSITSYDARFNGTSSACPTATGLIATILENNRTWTWQNVRNWLHDLTPHTSSTFYIGVEPSTATDPSWSDLNSLQGAAPRVLYNASLVATTAINFVSLNAYSPASTQIPVTASGGTGVYSYSISPALPAGLSYSSTGTLSGTPTVLSSTATYTVTVDDQDDVASATFSLNVYATPLVSQLTTSTVKIQPLTTTTAFTPVTVTGGNGAKTFGISPALPGTLTINAATGQINPGVVTTLFTTTFTVTVSDQVGQSTSKQFTLISEAPPLSLSVDYPTVRINPFVTILPIAPVSTVGGFGTKTYSISPSLPGTLTFNTATGEIGAGVVTTLFTTTFTISVSDQVGQSSSTQFDLVSEIVPLSVNTQVASRTVLALQPISPYVPVAAGGGSGVLTYSVTPALPAGIVFNTATGQVSGTPSVLVNNSTHLVTVSDQLGQSLSANFSITVQPVPIVINTGTKRVVYLRNQTITPFVPLSASGGSGVLTYSINPPLPEGLTLNPSTGALSGNTGLYMKSTLFTMTVADQLGQSKNYQFSIKIASELNLIESEDQNLVHDALFSIMGTTATGYGAVLIGDPVDPGQLVEADEWNELLMDVERCLIHQNGTSTNNIIAASTGSIVDFATPARMYTTIQFLQKNIDQVHPSQLDSFTYNTNQLSPVYWTSTNYSSTATMVAGNGYMTTINWTWFYENQLRYFFNLGGTLQPQIKIAEPTGANAKKGWKDLIAAANQVVFGKEEFLQALSNPNKTFIYTVVGSGAAGDAKGKVIETRKTKIISEKYGKRIIYKNKDAKNYSANALTVTFRVMGSTIVGSMNFVAGLALKKAGPKKKTGKEIIKYNKKNNKKHIFFGKKVIDIFTKKIIGKYIGVRVRLETDFKTTYSTGANGGIAAQIPQTQLIGNYVSAAPSPVPEFVMGVGDTESQMIVLRNNSTFTCEVSDIVLSGYTTGTVTPTTLTIPAFSSGTFSLSYTGSHAGHHKGLVDVLCNVNRLTLFTEVNVGSTNPPNLVLTTSTYDVISQDFVVDHAGGYFKSFDLNFVPGPGFTHTPKLPDTIDSFNVTFNPKNLVNGVYTAGVEVTVTPLDSSQEPTVWTVPVAITLAVENRHIADWTSCKLGNNTKLGLSYDIIGGRTYLTAGIGLGSPSIAELGVAESNFDSWSEVYRIPLEATTRRIYSKDYRIKAAEDFVYGEYFGVGSARGSILTCNYDGKGNLEVLMNTVYTVPGQNTNEVLDLSTAFRYYDSRRSAQLQQLSGLTQGGQCYVFNGFERSGDLMLNLVLPN